MSNSIKAALEEARALVRAIRGDLDGAAQSITNISKNAREAQTSLSFKGPKAVNEELEKSNKIVKELSLSTKAQEKASLDLAKAIVKQEQATTAANQALVKKRLESQLLNKINKDDAILTSKLTSFYQKQNVILNRLTKRRQDLLLRQKLNNDLTEKETKELIKLTKAQTKLDKAFKETDDTVGRNQRSVGNYGNALKGLKKILTGLIGAFGVVEGLRMTFNFVKEAKALAQEAKGVEFAFARLGSRGEEAFNKIKKSTRGLLSDFDIKKSINEFEQFNLSLEQSDVLFEFLGVAAAETGKSVEKLKDSLVEGLSKESKLRIDNLGISASELNAELKKTPEFIDAVANIARRKVAAAGDILDDAANSQAKWNAELQNFKLRVGQGLINNRFIQNLREGATEVLNFIAPTKQLSDAILEEQISLNVLIGAITDVNTENKEREKLLIKLKEEYPQFLTFLDDERTDNESLATALGEVNQLYIKKIALLVQQEKIDALLKKSGNNQFKLTRDQIDINRELARINSQVLKGSLDLTNTSYEERIKLVKDALVQNAEFVKIGGITSATNAEGRALQELNRKILASVGSKRALKDSTKELTEEEKLLKELEEQLGTTISDLNKLLGNNTKENDRNTSSTKDANTARKEQESILKSVLEAGNQLKRQLGDVFVSGIINNEQYLRSLDRIDTALDGLVDGYDALKTLENPLEGLSGTLAPDMLKPIEDLEFQIKNLPWGDALAKASEFFGEMGNLASTLYDGNIQRIDDEINRNDLKYSELLKNETLSLEQRAALEAEQEGNRLQLEKKKREEQKKQAIVQKAFSASQIIANTAVAISKTLAETGVFGIPLTAIVAAQGALQLATVLAQPIPEFKDGYLEGDYAGKAKINDEKGSSYKEIVERKSGRLEMFNQRNKVITMQKGDKVHKAGTFNGQDITRQVTMMNMMAQGQMVNDAMINNSLTADFKQALKEFNPPAPQIINKTEPINYRRLAKAVSMQTRANKA